MDEIASEPVMVRMKPSFRAELKPVAQQFHEGNEAALVRAAARLYLRLRQRLGPQLEQTLMTLWAVSIHEDDPRDGKDAAR